MLTEAKARTLNLLAPMKEQGIGLAVFTDESPVIFTPLMESEMVAERTWVTGVRIWGRARREVIGERPAEIWIEKAHIPAIMRNFLDESFVGVPLKDIGPVLGAQRMIKSPFEVVVMKQAGEIAGAMIQTAHQSCV